jgi:hypothetical protein
MKTDVWSLPVALIFIAVFGFIPITLTIITAMNGLLYLPHTSGEQTHFPTYNYRRVATRCMFVLVTHIFGLAYEYFLERCQLFTGLVCDEDGPQHLPFISLLRKLVYEGYGRPYSSGLT